MSDNKQVAYGCWCPGSLFWVAVGALLLIGGLTSFLYVSNVWTQIEVRYAGALALTLLGAFIIGAIATKRR